MLILLTKPSCYGVDGDHALITPPRFPCPTIHDPHLLLPDPYGVISHTVPGLVCVTVKYSIGDRMSFVKLGWVPSLGSFFLREANCHVVRIL